MDATLSNALEKAREALTMVKADTKARVRNLSHGDRRRLSVAFFDSRLCEGSIAVQDVVQNVAIEDLLERAISMLEAASSDRTARIGPEL